jgi:cytochrome c-type biogenesis protein CcmH/NrfF
MSAGGPAAVFAAGRVSAAPAPALRRRVPHPRPWRSIVPLFPLGALALVLGVQPVRDAAGAPADAPRDALIIEIEEALVCQCGCGLTVHACNHLNCPSGVPIKEEIVKRLTAGETKEQILAHFQERYGEKVLSAPTLRGFNLVAWIAPGVFVALGVGLVAVVTRRWSRAAGAPAAAPGAGPAAAAGDDPYRERLAREIRDFDG